jgi:surfactin family lipopeptide synthetase A
LSGARLKKLLAFWRGELARAPILDLVPDRPRPAIPSFQGGSVPITLASATTQKLQVLAQEQGATLFMGLLTVFSVLLSRYSGQDDLVVGTPVAGRTRGELEGLIGFFVNTLVLRSDLGGNPSFRELLARTRDRAVQAYAHQELPFEKLVEELEPERDLSRNPLCQVFFQLADAPSVDVLASSDGCRANDLSPGFSWASPPLSGESSKFDLNLSLWNGRRGVSGRLEYSSDLFERGTAARMADRFQVLLESLVSNPDDPISTVPFLTADERQQLDGSGAGGSHPWDLESRRRLPALGSGRSPGAPRADSRGCRSSACPDLCR